MPHCKKQMISFFLTTKCNLCCTYCYNIKERAQLEEKSLSLEMAKAGIDDYFKNNQSRHIRFYGPGEPTQEFALMKEVTAYAKTVGGSTVTVEIQTNGIFSEEVREWMLENINIMWLSFDGPPDIQDFNRPINPNYYKVYGESCASAIEDNVKWFYQHKGDRNLMVGARVTITNNNVSRQKEMVDYFYNLGIRYVWTDPLFQSVEHIAVCNNKNAKANDSLDMEVYTDNYIEAYHYAKGKGLFYGSFLTINFDGESKTHCRACTPAPHLTPDGYLSACDMIVFGEKAYHMSPLIYGKWNDQTKKFDLFKDRLIEIKARNVDNMSHCKTCEAKLHCGGYCLGEVLNETDSLLGQKPIICKAVRKLFKELGSCEPYEYLHP